MARKIKQNSSGGSLKFSVAVGVVFIILKLANVIDWSWWLVLAPIYVPALIIFLFFIGLVVHLLRQQRRQQ